MPTLTQINLDDLVSSFSWQDSPLLAAILRRIFFRPAHKFARQMLNFDALVGAVGLAEASTRTLRGYVKQVRVFGSGNIPDSGPLLVLSNHPGMTDTLALFSALRRPDLKIIAVRRPFLQSLTETTKNLFTLSDDPAERMSVVRRVAAHLKSGGAALTFPAGQIEPDPAVYPGALAALDRWTDSAGVFVRFAPETRILPVLVSGVLWDKAVRHPLTRLKRPGPEREKLGAAFQLLAQLLFDVRPVTVKIQIGEPICEDEAGSTDIAVIHAKVIERMRGLLENPPESEGKLIL
jgi:1-acyl-sn-glycerol-3-phosphate acyltransferase